MSERSDRAAAFEQWAQGGGNSDSQWSIARADAAYVLGTLRGMISRATDRAEKAEKGRAKIRKTFADGVCTGCGEEIDWDIGYLLAHDGLWCMHCAFPALYPKEKK